MASQRSYRLNNCHFHSKGTILIIILVLSTLIAMLANVAMESGILQIKMANNFMLSLQVRKQVEEDVKLIEEKLSMQWMSILPKEVRFLQFVPDTLMFAEKRGANYYQIDSIRKNEDGTSYHVVTTFSVRAKIDQESQTQKPIIARLPSGQWISVNICVHDVLKQTQITIVDLHHGNQLFQTSIKTRITSDIVAIDSTQQNFSDVAYMGDEDGYIWKLHFNNNWQITCHHVLGMGKIQAQIVVGKHPQGKGVLIYVINENPSDKQLILHVLSDVNNIIKPFFICKHTVSLEQFVLWQGYLIVSDISNKMTIYDAFTGLNQFEGALSRINELENSVAIDNQYPMVFVSKPIDDMPIFYCLTKHGYRYGQFSIKNNRLGRRTWKSKKLVHNLI